MMWRALSLVLALCSSAFAQDGHRPIVPPWVFPNAQVDCDFANQRYYNCPLYSNLSITRASTGLAQDAQSGIWYSYANNILRVSSRGLLIEEASTNNGLWARNLTQSGTWTATDIAPTLDAVGIDGTANSATTLTATGANGTILQAITLASATQVYSLHVKRVTGSGNIQATLDNSTYTTLSSANCVDSIGAASNIVTTGFVWCTISQAALTNPTAGIKIVTQNDVIVVDGNQLENLGVTYATSPIFTTTTTQARATDSITVIGLLLAQWQLTSGSGLIVGGGTLNSANTPRLLTRSSTNYLAISSTTVCRLIVANSSVNATLGSSGSTTGRTSCAFTWGNGNALAGIAANGGTLATVGSFILGGTGNYQLGALAGATANFYDGYIRRIAFAPAQQLQNLSGLSNRGTTP